MIEPGRIDPEPREYVFSKGWKRGMYIGGPFLMGLGLFTCSVMFWPGREQLWWAYVMVLAGGLFLFGLGALGLLEAIRFKLVLTRGHMKLTTALRHFDMAKNEIGAIRVGTQQGTLTIKLFDTRLRKLATLNACFDVDEYLTSWFDELRNLDQEENQGIVDEVLKDDRLGVSEGERRTNGERILKYARWVNVGVFVLTLWATFRPVPYLIVLGLVASFLPFSIWAMWRFGSLFALEDRDNSPVQSLQGPILMPSIVLTLRAMFDTHPVDWTAVLAPSITVAMGIGYLFFRLQSRARWYTVLSLVLFTIGYPAGLLLIVNERFDNSRGEKHRVVVMDKRISKGKTTERYVTVSAGGPWTETHELKVHRRAYEESETGKEMCLQIYHGSLGMEWWSLRENCRD